MQMFAQKWIKRLLLLSAIMFSGIGHAQELAELRHFNTASYKMDFYISIAQKKINYADTLNYHWFKSQKLHITQGGSAGNLLHGNFLKFHINGQLAERGEFKYGLKHGEWMSWYESGELKSKLNYQAGRLKGSFLTFSRDGSISEKGKFKKGRKKLAKAPKEEKQEEFEDSGELPWYKRIFQFEKKENPEREAKRLEKRTSRQEKKMKKEREVNND